MTTTPGTLDLELPAAAEALTSMRQSLRSWLGDLGVEHETVEELALVCTEVCSNSIEHADGAHPIRVTARVIERVVRVEVRDRGHWHYEGPSPERGNGLRLVRALMDEVAIRRYDDGTDVVMYRWLEDAEAAASAR